MKVLHLLWRGDIGGAERALFQLIAAQRGDGSVEPGLLLGGGGGPYADRVRALGVPVAELHLGGAADPRALVRAPRAMRGWDIHHFHSAEPSLMAASLLVRGAVRVYTNRGGFAEGSRAASKRGRHAAVGVMLRNAFHGYSGNTAHAAHVAAARYGLDRESISVTRNGLDFGLLRPNRPREDVRAELGAGPNEVLVGTSGVLKAWKRVERLLEAVAGTGDPRVHAVVIGDGPARPALERRAAQLGLGDRAHFTGMLDSVADHVAALDVFVLTSGRQESFGNAVVEAMALGVPSIVFSDSPGAREHIDHGLNGLVVGDVTTLSSAILTAGDPATAQALGDAGAASVRDRYAPARMMRAYRELYESAVLRAGRG